MEVVDDGDLVFFRLLFELEYDLEVEIGRGGEIDEIRRIVGIESLRIEC